MNTEKHPQFRPEEEFPAEDSDLNKLFELEKEIDMRKRFIESHSSNESQGIKNRIKQFQAELALMKIEMIKLRLKRREQGLE